MVLVCMYVLTAMAPGVNQVLEMLFLRGPVDLLLHGVLEEGDGGGVDAGGERFGRHVEYVMCR